MIRGVLLLIFKYYNKTAWRMKRLAGCLGTYDSEPVDDRDCRLLFKARSLSPCVRPFLSSSSLYCNTYKRQWLDKVKGVHFLLNKKSKKKVPKISAFQTHQFHFFFLGRPVFVASIDGYVVHSRQDPGHSHLSIFSFILHLLPEYISLCPQTILLPEI